MKFSKIDLNKWNLHSWMQIEKKKDKNKSDGVIVSMWILSPDSNVLFMYYK